MTYDVLQEAWIPVVTENGKHRKVGILEALENAHKYREISDASPMVEYSLYRFLIVFLMDALRPEDAESIEELLEEGQFDMDAIQDYLALCRREGVSFDLFDEDRPFLQWTDWDKKQENASWGWINRTVPKGDNAPHFYHLNETEPLMSCAEALSFLITAQVFATAGGRGITSGVQKKPPYYTLVKGKNLFETLLNSMVSLDVINNLDDPPVLWRQVSAELVGKKLSWLSSMIYPARRVLFFPDEKTGKISSLYVKSGPKCENRKIWTDPHVAYDHNLEPFAPEINKPVWKNLNIIAGKRGRPRIVELFAQRNRSEYVNITLYSVDTEKNDLHHEYLRHDLIIPKKIIDDEERMRIIENAISSADTLAEAMALALFVNRKESDWKKDCTKKLTAIRKGTVPQYITQALQDYYDACEKKFWSIMDREFSELEYNACFILWADFIIQTAQQIFMRTVSDLTFNMIDMAKIYEQKRKTMDYQIVELRKKMKEAGELCGTV